MEGQIKNHDYTCLFANLEKYYGVVGVVEAGSDGGTPIEPPLGTAQGNRFQK